jgi:hypothetical protein
MQIMTVHIHDLELTVRKNDGDSNIWLEFYRNPETHIGTLLVAYLYTGCCESYGIRTTGIHNTPIIVHEL